MEPERNGIPGSGGTAPVREGFRFDEDRLSQWLKANVDGYAPPMAIEQFQGGQSNPTFKLVTPGRSYVMRRKPGGEIHSSAHAVDREYRIMAALGPAGFPVPKVHALCTDTGVIGTWFYVMDCVEGANYWDAKLPAVSPQQRGAIFDAMNTTLARLHGIDFAGIGLGDYGRPGNYVERQVSRFSRQYLADADAGRLAALDRLIEWLPANLPPEEGVSIVHGDYKLDNLIFHPREPRVAAVLDWELSTLGNPVADFAYNAMMFRMPQGVEPSVAGADPALSGLPSEADYVAQYCRLTGRQGLPHLSFYIAFNMFRLAAIMHGIKGRIIRGNASSAQAGTLISRMEALADAAWSQAQRAQEGN